MRSTCRLPGDVLLDDHNQPADQPGHINRVALNIVAQAGRIPASNGGYSTTPLPRAHMASRLRSRFSLESRPALVLIVLILSLAAVLVRGVGSTFDLLVVLMVGVVLVDTCYFVDPLVGLLRYSSA
jgi:hypothetical protein